MFSAAEDETRRPAREGEENLGEPFVVMVTTSDAEQQSNRR